MQSEDESRIQSLACQREIGDGRVFACGRDMLFVQSYGASVDETASDMVADVVRLAAVI